ncbi:MAG: hypothetical protein HFJ60_04610 [Clostridia bacterium]|jgi:hypothetical protein|nr:hypothetical protein [Clostridia bacterium]
MKCQGNFVFKSFAHKDGGVFKNEKGEEIKYPASYTLKVDELMDNGDINERKFKVSEKQVVLINDLKSLEAYQKIILNFNVTIYATKISIEVDSVDVNVED